MVIKVFRKKWMLYSLFKYFSFLKECLTKCSALVNSREIAKLSIMFSEIHHEIKEKDDKKNAAIKIQSFWRGVLTRRKTKIMLKGFRKFQILYREKLQVSIMS